MCGKIYQTFFDSSINETDPMTRFVFVALIVLSDQFGRVDMTPLAFSRRINIPVDEVIRALSILSQPDGESRSVDHEGRRLLPLDPNRSWGWIVVNKPKYRLGDPNGPDPERERAQNRERQRRHREKAKTEETPKTNTPSVTDNGVTCDMPGEELRRRFEIAWAEYPRKAGKGDAWRHYRASIRTADEADRLLAHLRNYKSQLAADRTEAKFVLNGSRWFANWTDEIYASAPQPVRRKPPMRDAL